MAIARWKDLCIDVAAPTATSPEAAFWAAALGLRHVADHHDPAEVGKLVGELPTQTVWLNVVPEPKTVKNRVHLDVHAGSVAEIEALGARALSAPGQFRWTVMADPEGQELCVFVRAEVPAYKLYEIVVDAVDAPAVARWWQDVLGGDLTVAGGAEAGGADIGGAEIGGAEDGAGDDAEATLERVPGLPFECLVFGNVPEPRTTKNRVHWDVDVDGPEGLEALVAHGATILRPRDAEIDWTQFADPEGNVFCAFTPE